MRGGMPPVSQCTAFMLGFFDLLGVSLVVPFLTIRLHELAKSPIIYGLSGTTYGLLQYLSAPLFGIVSAVQGRRKAIVLSFYLSSLTLMFLSFDVGMMHFFVIRSVAGIVKHTQGLLKSYLSENTTKLATRAVLDRFSRFARVGLIVGPFAGCFFTRFNYPCIVVCVLFLCCAFLANMHLHESRTHRRYSESLADQSMGPAVQAAVRAVGLRRLWNTFNGRLLLGLAVGIYQSNLGYELITKFSLTAYQLGLVSSFMGATAFTCDLLAEPLVERCAGRIDCLLVSCSVVAGSSLLVLGLTSNLMMSLILLLVFQASSSLAAIFEVEMTARKSGGYECVAPLQLTADRIMPMFFALTPLLNGLLQAVRAGSPAYVASCVAFAATGIFLTKKPPRLNERPVYNQVDILRADAQPPGSENTDAAKKNK